MSFFVAIDQQFGNNFYIDVYVLIYLGCRPFPIIFFFNNLAFFKLRSRYFYARNQ